MAASGIAEHNEARRRMAGYERKAFIQRQQKRAQADVQMLPSGDRPLTTYDQQVYTQSRQGELAGRHDAATVDAQRRLDHYNQSRAEYSAKIPHRYSSIDYASQW